MPRISDLVENDFIRNIFFSFIKSGGITLVFCLFYNFFIAPFKKKGSLKKAIAKGNIVTLTQKNNRISTNSNGDQKWIVTYAYQYKGRTYKKRYTYDYNMQAPQIIEMYFRKSPRCVQDESTIGRLETTEWLPLFVVLFVFAIII